MTKHKSAVILSFFGLLIIAGSLITSIYFEEITPLFLLIPGVLFTLISLRLSLPGKDAHTRKTPASNESYNELTPLSTITKNNVLENTLENLVVDEESIIEAPLSEEVEAEDDLRMLELMSDIDQSDNLLRLITAMNEMNMVHENIDFNLDDAQDIFLENIDSIPVIALVKNRNQNYNVLAGLTHQNISVIGTFKKEDLDYVDHYYPMAQTIQAKIVGGPYKDSNSKKMVKPHKVYLKIYI